MTARSSSAHQLVVGRTPGAADDEPTQPTVLRRAEPRIEFDPRLSGDDPSARIGGYYPTASAAAHAAEYLAFDTVIPAAHPRLGFWLTPAARAVALPPSSMTTVQPVPRDPTAVTEAAIP